MEGHELMNFYFRIRHNLICILLVVNVTTINVQESEATKFNTDNVVEQERLGYHKLILKVIFQNAGENIHENGFFEHH